MANRTLYLIRHGQYDSALKVRDGGGLTDVGKQQAEYAARAMQSIPLTAIVASTMLRAIETATIIAEAVDMQYTTTPLLREAIPSIPPRIATHILDLMARDPHLTHESIHEDQKRADEAFTQFFIPPPQDTDANDALVCHGNILRYLACKALGVNADTWAKMNINHCGITVFMIDENGLIRLHSHNETRHLPTDLITD